MKKLFSTLMVMACLVLAIPAQAQIKFGVKGGLNISKMYISKDVMKSDNRSGFFIGPTAEFTLPLLGLGVDVSALYNQYGAKAEGETATRKTIEIPVNLNWTIGFSSIIGGCSFNLQKETVMSLFLFLIILNKMNEIFTNNSRFIFSIK